MIPARQFFCDGPACGEPFWSREAEPACPKCRRIELVTAVTPPPCQAASKPLAVPPAKAQRPTCTAPSQPIKPMSHAAALDALQAIREAINPATPPNHATP